MSNLLKNLLIALGLAIVLWIGYTVFFQDSSSSSELLTSSQGTDTAEASLQTEQFLMALNELKSYDFEKTIFTNNNFNSLIDTRVVLGTETSGRENPFEIVR
jgi:hypothetical protein